MHYCCWIHNHNRAEDWNLAKPLQTCSLLVERRGDQLVLEFFTAPEGKLFAQSIVDCSVKEGSDDEPPKRIQYWLEQVVDSSRYFTLRILGGQGREATIGFGFRDREQATDLRESMQHYENSIRREQEAAKHSNSALQYHIPKLAEGEKMHINTGKDGDTASAKKDSKSAASATDGKKKAVPLLLKKPPPSPKSAAQEKPEVVVNPKVLAEMRISLGDVDLEKEHEAAVAAQEPGASSGVAAVYEGDEEDWDTEFQSA